MTNYIPPGALKNGGEPPGRRDQLSGAWWEDIVKLEPASKVSLHYAMANTCRYMEVHPA